ncbi:DUF4034 domain-containing protein, partial [Xanthomonas sp. Kuri4-1]
MEATRFREDLLAQRFAPLQARLQGLLDAGDAAAEQTLDDHLEHYFGGMVGHHDTALRQALAQWARQSPDSPWPGLLECAYWHRRALQARGSALADEVEAERWQAAALAQTVLFSHALVLMQRAPMPWILPALLMQSVQVFGEPQWLAQWRYQGVAPHSLDAPRPDASAADQHPQLDSAPLPPLQQASAAHTPQEGEPEAFFWLQLTLRHAGRGLVALLRYAFLRTPRWGGSLEEILCLADSPLAVRLDEAQRNQVRLVAWLDDIDIDNIDTDDATEIAQAMQRGLAALQRPLEPDGRARLHLALAELYAVAQSPTQAAPHYAAATQSPRLAIDDHQLMRALHVAVYSGSLYADWLGVLASRTAASSAHAAVLYGLLCDTGWGGVQRDVEVAAQWYRHASTLAPLPAPEQVCPFNDVYYAFDEHLQRTVLQPMARSGAELGYPEMQFALGYYYFEYEDSYDPVQAIHWYRRAAAHGFPRAAYNLSLIYDRGIDAGGIAGLAPDALALLSNDCEIACLDATAALAEPTERGIERGNACIRGLRHFLTHHSDQHERVARILAVLTRFAHLGWPEAMRGLGYFYALTPNTALRDFDRAVQWCEAAYRLAPDDADNQELRQELQGDGFLARRRYTRAAARVRAEPLPRR